MAQYVTHFMSVLQLEVHGYYKRLTILIIFVIF